MEHIENEAESAIASSDVNAVRNLFENYKHFDLLKDSEKLELLNSSLSKAVTTGNLEIVKFLITLGADVNCEDQLKRSILQQATLRNGEDTEAIILHLIQNGADINHQCTLGKSSFMYLVSSGVISFKHLVDLVDSVQNVHEKCLNTGGNYLHMLSKRHDDRSRPTLIKKFLQVGVQINGKDYNDDTPLHLMASIACCDSMSMLIVNGADIKARNRLGETILHYLASYNEYNGFLESFKLLLDKGVDINDVDSLGRTALHHALFSKDTTSDAIKVFIEYGINFNISDCEGKNEMFHAVEDVDQAVYDLDDLKTRAGVITEFAEVGVDINKGDSFGITPLHQAMKSRMVIIISALVRCNADINKRTQTGATPLHWACKRNSMVRILIARYQTDNFDINVKDKFGSTPLHWAIWYRETSVVHTLLHHGCDMNMKDNDGVSPTDLAKKVRFDEMFSIIAAYGKNDIENLKDAVNTCSGEDPLYACPHLRYIKKSKDRLHMEVYVDHLILHEKAVKKCIDTALKLKNMGLYYDIKENVDIPNLIKMLMNTLAQNVSKRNELFSCELLLRGSSVEGTKVGLPNEFDYLWNLREFSKAFVPVEEKNFPNGFIQLRLIVEANRDRFSDYLTRDNLLDCRVLSRHFYSLLNEELRKILDASSYNNFSNITCKKFLNEICFSVATFHFVYYGQEAKDLEISVDIVPHACLGQWRPCALSDEVLQHLKKDNENFAFSAVFKTPDRVNIKDFYLYQRVSYAQLEQCVFKTTPVEVKKAYIVLKVLLDSGYVPVVVDHDLGMHLKQYISSYKLKTCLMHVLEQTLRTNSDDHSTLQIEEKTDFETAIEWAKKAIYYFGECIEKGHLPVYFDHSKNLLSIEGIQVEGATGLGVLRQLTSLMMLLLEIYEDDTDDMQNNNE